MGFYLMYDITDPDYWEFYTWDSGGSSSEMEYAQVSDNTWVYDLNYDFNGPVNQYIYHEVYSSYDIVSCPTVMVYDHAGGSGLTYFDGQGKEGPGMLTAPASDPDMINFDDRYHLVWQYENQTTQTSQIVWKKIVWTEQPDIEYTPYQQYVADGTHPSLAGYGDNIAIVYMDGADVKCVYTDDDGETWDTSTVATGEFPNIEAIGSQLRCVYIHEGNLFMKTSTDGGATWGTEEQMNDQAGTVVAEENSVDIHSVGIAWTDNRNGDTDIAFYVFPAEFPDKPETPDGPAQIKTGEEGTYTTSARDPQGDQVYFWFDWGNGENSGWVGPFASEAEGSADYSWPDRGTYEVKVKVKDEHDNENPTWSDPFVVEVPRSRDMSTMLFRDFIRSLLDRLFDIGMFPLLQTLLD
jgi:hypothetical protein